MKYLALLAASVTFILSWISLYQWQSKSYNLNHASLSILNVTGFTYLEIDEKQCTRNHFEAFICCVNLLDYAIGSCPIVFKDYCETPGKFHVSGARCNYTPLLSRKSQPGHFVDCKETVCDEYAKLYNKCIVYSCNQMTLHYCSKQKVQLNEQVSIELPFVSGKYTAFPFKSGDIFYDKASFPIKTEKDLKMETKTADDWMIAFMILVSLNMMTFTALLYFICQQNDSN